MKKTINEQRWHQLSEEVMTGMREWRLKHRKATLREIENELDGRLARMRARMLEDLAMQSEAAEWEARAEEQPPKCPTCGVELAERGSHVRILDTHGGETITLERSYGVCPTCKSGVFPPG
jgi:hypothetical protein